MSLVSQSSFYAAPTLTCPHYFNPKFPMKNPSGIKTNMPKTTFLTLQICSPSFATVNGSTIPECSTLTSQNHLWLFPFLHPTSICHFLLQNAPSFFLLPPFLLSHFYSNSILRLSVSNLPFQSHSIYNQTSCLKILYLFWIFTPQYLSRYHQFIIPPLLKSELSQTHRDLPVSEQLNPIV